MADGVDKGYAQIELDKLKEQRAAAVVTAPYDGVIAACCYSAVGSDVKSGTLLCRVMIANVFNIILRAQERICVSVWMLTLL